MVSDFQAVIGSGWKQSHKMFDNKNFGIDFSNECAGVLQAAEGRQLSTLAANKSVRSLGSYFGKFPTDSFELNEPMIVGKERKGMI